MKTPPVVVIGAGPVGLAAAAHLLTDGLEPIVLEAGETVGHSVADWGHVRLFSPWRYNIDAAAASMLTAAGWTVPDVDRLPTGKDIVEQYLQPLSELAQVRGRLRTSSRVVAVTRRGADKVNHDRDDAPFLVRVRQGLTESEVEASAIIDASGTWRTPNPVGADGVPALGETVLADMLTYGIPDVLGRPERYVGRTTAVVGGGHSAANVVLALIELRDRDPATTVHWVVRGRLPRAYGGGGADELPARGALGTSTRAAVSHDDAVLHTGFAVVQVSLDDDERRLVLTSADGRTMVGLDEVVVATGQRPDLAVTSELRLDLDEALDSTRELAPLIDPNVHSCGTVRPHTYLHLAHADEPGFFTVGAKSYGRAPTFLMATGYEQVRSVSAHLAGDEERARRVNLVLPETGVCGSSGGAGTGCCGTAPAEYVTVNPLGQ